MGLSTVYIVVTSCKYLNLDDLTLALNHSLPPRCHYFFWCLWHLDYLWYEGATCGSLVTYSSAYHPIISLPPLFSSLTMCLTLPLSLFASLSWTFSVQFSYGTVAHLQPTFSCRSSSGTGMLDFFIIAGLSTQCVNTSWLWGATSSQDGTDTVQANSTPFCKGTHSLTMLVCTLYWPLCLKAKTKVNLLKSKNVWWHHCYCGQSNDYVIMHSYKGFSY